MKKVEYLVVARVQDLLLGFDVADVREVLNDEEILEVPLTDAVVRGLINLRGEVVTVVDARTLLQMGTQPHRSRYCSLVLQNRKNLLCLEVDDVLEVAPIDSGHLVERPEGMSAAVRHLSSSLLHRNNDLVLVANVPQIFDVITHGVQAGERPES